VASSCFLALGDNADLVRGGSRRIKGAGAVDGLLDGLGMVVYSMKFYVSVPFELKGVNRISYTLHNIHL
jgi:hypothetical protein